MTSIVVLVEAAYRTDGPNRHLAEAMCSRIGKPFPLRLPETGQYMPSLPDLSALRLENYGIDPKWGFLPQEQPLVRLPDAYYEPWESILNDISHLLMAWKLRERLAKVPLLQVLPENGGRLQSEAEFQRAFLVLSLLSHAYVWGAKGEPVAQVLPRNLSKPWLQISERLGLRPISCHAALVYYNWRLLDPEQPADLSNLATLHTVSGGIDESWFYLITIAIEAKGARALPAMLDCLQAIGKNELSRLADNLSTVASVIKDMTSALIRMPENCDPYIFYHRVRIYFSGWSNMKDLPDGLLYEGDEGEIEKMFVEEGCPQGCANVKWEDIKAGAPVPPKKYPGGSAAQSALIHSLDVFLGVKHFPTGMKRTDVSASSPSTDKIHNFLADMRYHMPKNFRRWLTDLEKAQSVHDYLRTLQKQELEQNDIGVESVLLKQALDAYDQCVDNMRDFRDKHIQIVTRYIVIQSRRAEQTGMTSVEGQGYHGMGPQANQVIRLDSSAPLSPVETDTSAAPVDPLVNNDGLTVIDRKAVDRHPMTVAAGSRGTGGTEVIPFLKQSRDETAAVRL